MNINHVKTKLLLLPVVALLMIACTPLNSTTKKGEKIHVLIVTGQNNHYWKNSTPIFREILEDAGIFSVDVAISPETGKDMSAFSPTFSAYNVVVLDYNGDSWNTQTKTNFESFVENGGGVVVIHAADNAFPDWKEYNKMIGLGGWGDRDEKSGPYVYWKDGKAFYDYSPGSAGSHGKQWEYAVRTWAPEHPIMKGIPAVWLHATDELYDRLRGPGENMEILATAYSDKNTNGSGREEPILFTIRYGKGRIFHTVMGHADEQTVRALQCAGFVYTLQRGTEWAATGKVKQAIPEKWPTKTNILLLEKYQIK